MKNQQNKLKRISFKDKIIIFLPISFFMIFAIVPFIAMVSGSLSISDLIKDYGISLIPRGFSLAAYKAVFMFPQEILKSYFITIMITVIGTFLNMLLLIMLAFYLCRSTAKSTKYISFFVFFTLMFNAGLVPTYIWYNNILHITNTMFVLIISPAVSVGHLFLLRVFFSTVPPTLYESAKIDGASEYVILFKIATPLITPGIATITFYSVLMYWNDPFTALMYTDDIVPVSLYLSRISSFIEFLKFAKQGGIPGVDVSKIEIPESTLLYAMAIVTTGPMLFIFAFFQKYFVSGLTAGGVKG